MLVSAMAGVVFGTPPKKGRAKRKKVNVNRELHSYHKSFDWATGSKPFPSRLVIVILTGYRIGIGVVVVGIWISTGAEPKTRPLH